MQLIPLRLTLLAGLVAGLAACTVPDEQVEVFDPYEEQNRRVHEFNKGFDRALARPASNAYGTVLPRPVRAGVSNFSDNLDTPRYFVNDVLQGNVADAGHNFMRFLFNTTLGVFGIFDPATELGLEERSTGFGETLHVWGAEEGAYVELPVFGPSTERDAVGLVVDFVANPMSGVFDGDEAWVPPSATVGTVMDTRYELRDTIDSVLYESADSYSQARSVYLQRRRFELNDTEDFAFDPYEDFYAE